VAIEPPRLSAVKRPDTASIAPARGSVALLFHRSWIFRARMSFAIIGPMAVRLLSCSRSLRVARGPRIPMRRSWLRLRDVSPTPSMGSYRPPGPHLRPGWQVDGGVPKHPGGGGGFFGHYGLQGSRSRADHGSRAGSRRGGVTPRRILPPAPRDSWHRVFVMMPRTVDGIVDGMARLASVIGLAAAAAPYLVSCRTCIMNAFAATGDSALFPRATNHQL